MKRALAILAVGLAVGAACLGLSQQPERALNEPEAQARVQTGLRFEAFDLVVDSGPSTLSAYQIEVKANPAAVGTTKITLVGVEGGEHAAGS